MKTAAQLFLDHSRRSLVEEMWPRLCSCLDGLTEEQLWWRPNPASNSIGNLLLHLNGNVCQWILQGLGGAPGERNRDAEFAERGPVDAGKLRQTLERTLKQVDLLLARLSEQDLLQHRDIQVYSNVTGIEAIYHVVEHFAMHYGQILYISKLIRGEGLGFYQHLDPKPEA